MSKDKNKKYSEKVNISLEELRAINECNEDYDDYLDKSITINECPFFINTKAIYENYFISISTYGQFYVHYGEDGCKRVSLSYDDINRSSVKGGIYYKTSNGNWSNKILGLPIEGKVGEVLRELRKTTSDNCNKYKNSYEGAKKRLDGIDDVLKGYPEHMV